MEQTLADWKECVRTGEPWDVEHRFRAVDGSWRPILARGVPVRDDQDEIIAWAGINLDISQLKKVENELRESEARFRSMADNAPVLIWVNGVGGCQFVNKEYLKFTGKELEDIAGMGFTNFIHPDDIAGYVDAYLAAFKNQSRVRGPVPLPPRRWGISVAELVGRTAVPRRWNLLGVRGLLGRRDRHQGVGGSPEGSRSPQGRFPRHARP